MSTLTAVSLREADPAAWHHAADAWTRLAQSLETTSAALAGAGRDLPVAWARGLGAALARHRVDDLAATVSGAGEPVHRIAAALTEHAHALAALRRLACQDLSPPEQAALLAQMRLLDERTSAALLASRPPGGMAAPPASRGGSPEQVRAWWGSLPAPQRERLLREHPEAVGWLDGVPAADRDRANRVLLAERIEALTARQAHLADRAERLRFGLPLWLTPPVLLPLVVPIEIELAQVRARLEGLEAVQSTLAAYGAHALLLGIDGGDAGSRAVVALGDPDLARHTAVFVPGAGTDPHDLPGGVGRMAQLWREADAMTSDLRDVSVVYWLGYDPPDLLGTLSSGASRSGAGQLIPFLAGLAATHDATPAHVTLIGHSYGSTVVAEAGLAGGLRVDDIIAAGSPGMHTDHAADLRLDPRHVWGGLAPADAVGGHLGELPFVHGQEPTDPAFGANRFVVDTGGHDDYWDHGSVSLRNQAAIVVGRYDLVSLVHGRLPPGVTSPFPT
jgi:hypothetical protein